MKSPRLPDTGSANACAGMMSYCEALCSRPPPNPMGPWMTLKKTVYTAYGELPLFEHEQVGAEELSEILGATGDGKIDRIGRVVEIDEDVVSPPGRHAPRVLVGAIPMQCFARRVLRAEPMDVARIILDFVVARAPRGERNEQGVLAGRGKIGGHVE